mgnify:CR=1 FL=1
MKIKVTIENPEYWGNNEETSPHILLRVDDDSRSQRVEEWNNSSDSFGALADIIPFEMRDAIESIIEQELFKCSKS